MLLCSCLEKLKLKKNKTKETARDYGSEDAWIVASVQLSSG